MKRLLLLSIMMTAAICQASASERTIVKPESIYQNMLVRLRTDSVTMTDTATVFYLHITNRNENAFFRGLCQRCLSERIHQSNPTP